LKSTSTRIYCHRQQGPGDDAEPHFHSFHDDGHLRRRSLRVSAYVPACSR
jgi:hypothetical protein